MEKYIIHQFKCCGYMPELYFETFKEAVDYVDMVASCDRLASNMTSSQYARYEIVMKPLIEHSFTGYFSDCFNYSPKDGLDHKAEVMNYIMTGHGQLSKRRY